MKCIIAFVIILFIGFLSINRLYNPVISQQSSDTSITPTTSTESSTSKTYEVNGKMYEVQQIKSTVRNTVRLIPNFQNKKTASEAMNDYECNYLTSAGFYTPENTPTGLFISDGTMLKNFLSNRTLNGILSLTKNKEFQITSSPLDIDVLFAVQMGPQLFRNGLPEKLSIQNDEPARRIIVATTNNPEDLWLFAITDIENSYLGPLLAELPAHLDMIQSIKKVNLQNALNMDGGSASSFANENIFLQELTPVGSFLCIN